MKPFNFNTSVRYDEAAKERYHRVVRSRLKLTAKALGLEPSQYTLSSNLAGPAVSGEITLHTDFFYVQVSQGSTLPSILYRLCDGRKDYTGGRNMFAHADLLNTPEKLAEILKPLLAWGQACKRDNVSIYEKFVAFSDLNPFTQTEGRLQ